MGRRPIGPKAMTNAERQKRYRERHRAKTPGQKFRRQIRRAVEWFALWLSADEIQETLECFGMAWALDEFNRAKDGMAWGFQSDCHMGDVEAGLNINGNTEDWLGDEDRYRRSREEQQRKQAEWDAKVDALWEETLAECGGDDGQAKGLMFPRLLNLAA